MAYGVFVVVGFLCCVFANFLVVTISGAMFTLGIRLPFRPKERIVLPDEHL